MGDVDEARLRAELNRCREVIDTLQAQVEEYRRQIPHDEGSIRFSVTHTPAHWDDKIDSVTLMCGIHQVGGKGSMLIHKEVSVREAQSFAKDIVASCRIVERDR